jgi:hypothetical protein
MTDEGLALAREGIGRQGMRPAWGVTRGTGGRLLRLQPMSLLVVMDSALWAPRAVLTALWVVHGCLG